MAFKTENKEIPWHGGNSHDSERSFDTPLKGREDFETEKTATKEKRTIG